MSFAEAGSTGIPAPRAEHDRSVRTGGAQVLRLHTTHPASGVAVLETAGVLDINSATRFAEVLREHFDAATRTVVLDLSALSFLSTHGVVALLEAGHRALMRQSGLVLITGNRIVDRLLAVLDVADRFHYATTVEDAVADAAPPRRPTTALAPRRR